MSAALTCGSGLPAVYFCAGSTAAPSRLVSLELKRRYAFGAVPSHSRVQRHHVLRMHAGKGFGASSTSSAPKSASIPQKIAAEKELCPCCSGKKYEVCCEPYHFGSNPPTMEACLRARFAAFVKGKQAFLIKTFHPNYHVQKYNVGPGEAPEKLAIDVKAAILSTDYSDLRVQKVEEVSPDDGYITFSYQYVDKEVKPASSKDFVPQWFGSKPGAANKSASKITSKKWTPSKTPQNVTERSRFLRVDGLWQFAEYENIELPEAVHQQRAEGAAFEAQKAAKKAAA